MELSDRRSGAVQVGEFIKIYARDRPGKSEKKVIEPLPSFVFNISSILYSACFMDMADKSRKGYTAEVKALLTKRGVNKLSDINPKDYAALLAEVEVIVNAG